MVDESELAKIEKEEIEKYTPQLNDSKVKTKTFRPTETLLRETLIKFQEFAFIIGIENQTKEIEVINSTFGKRKNFIAPVIHVAINPSLIKQKFLSNSEDNVLDIIHSMFQTRKQYTKKWEITPKNHRFGISIYRLYVNSYIIEYSMFMSKLVIQEFPLDFKSTFLAQEPILALTKESLGKLKDRLSDKDKHSYYIYILQGLKNYQDDLINVYFNDAVEKEKLEKTLKTTCEDYELGKKGFDSRSQSIADKKHSLINLAQTRGIDINKKYRNVIDVKKSDQLGVYITPFNVDLTQSNLFSNFAYTKIDEKLTTCIRPRLSCVFLLQKVDKVSWLIFEQYLKEFTRIAIIPEEGTGFVDEWYISRRRYLQPAKVNIKISDFNCSVWLPFGQSPNFPNYVDAKEEIKRRLENAGFSHVKVSFRQESIVS